jgi:SAM-dependent methyltransferase
MKNVSENTSIINNNEFDLVINKLKLELADSNYEKFKEILWSNAEVVRSYLYKANVDGDSGFIKAYVDDALPRFFRTIELAGPYMKGEVLEIGANPYLMTTLIDRLFNCKLTLTNFFRKNIYESSVSRGHQDLIMGNGPAKKMEFDDLNVELSEFPYKPETFDLILFCEVLEHIVLNPMNVLAKLKGLLKPGGVIILTTPNALRLINVAHMLAGKNFFDRFHEENGVYGRHNREYSLSEVASMFVDHGFQVLNQFTADRYNYDLIPMVVDSYEPAIKLPWSGSELLSILKSDLSMSCDDRGDNVYILAKK